MKGKKDEIWGSFLVAASVVVLIITLAGKDNSLSYQLIPFSILLLSGVLLLWKADDKKSYWKKRKTIYFSKIEKKLQKEKEYSTLFNIAQNAPKIRVRESAENIVRERILANENYEQVTDMLRWIDPKYKECLVQRKRALLLSSLEMGVLSTEKAVEIIVQEAVRDDTMRGLLREADRKQPNITRRDVTIEVKKMINQKISFLYMPFLTEVAKLYPDVIRGNWQALTEIFHTDANKHEDVPTGYHVDRIMGYSHQDTRVPYSDCHEDSHSDSNKHNDDAHLERLALLKPYID